MIARLAGAAGLATLLAACSSGTPPGTGAPLEAAAPPARTAAALPDPGPEERPLPAPAPELPSPAAAIPPGQRAADEALAQVGIPYRFGGTGPGGFDCSGLVQHAYRQAGITLPRDTREQRRGTRAVADVRNDLAPGDLLFFRRDRAGALHVALYVGERRFVHAPSRGKAVRVERLDDPHWRRRFLEARRPS